VGAPHLPRLAGGAAGFALVYIDDDGQPIDHAWRLQRLDASGAAIGAPVEVARTTRASSLPFGDVEATSVAMRADGVVAVAWTGGAADGSDLDVYARAYAADGTPCGDTRLVDTTTAGLQQLPSIAPLGDAFLLIWNDASASPDDPDAGAVRGRVLYVACP
jgi:hypothetical protein